MDTVCKMRLDVQSVVKEIQSAKMQTTLVNSLGLKIRNSPNATCDFDTKQRFQRTAYRDDNDDHALSPQSWLYSRPSRTKSLHQ